ncbi:MAG: hypothetical protein AAGF24_02510 [Cyanobacteria bacterium P01_H01_bin.121]
MAQYLKRWESPRREGRNRKGKGGSARKRQKVKQLKRLKQRLQQGQQHGRPKPGQPPEPNIKATTQAKPKGERSLPFFIGVYYFLAVTRTDTNKFDASRVDISAQVQQRLVGSGTMNEA